MDKTALQIKKGLTKTTQQTILTLEIIMSYYIITAIVALAAARAKAQAKDNLTKPKCREKSDGKREVANKWAGHEII